MSEQHNPSLPRQYSPPIPGQPSRTKGAEESRQQLTQAIQGSNQVLATARTVFELFPDTITIDRAKVTVTRRHFFRSAQIMSVRIEDVLNTTCTVGPVFGSITVISRVMNADQTTTVTRFWRADAVRLKRVLQGYIIALQRQIDCSKLGTEELSSMLEELGADDHPAT